MHTLKSKWTISLALAATLSLTAAPALAAKCRYNVDTVNHRTGEKVLWTQWNTFRMRVDPVMHAATVEGDKKYLSLGLMLDRGKRSTLPTPDELDRELVFAEGAKLLLLMADESVIELRAAEAVVADTNMRMSGPSTYVISSEVVVKYELDAETMAALSAQKLKVLRMTANDAEYTYEFGKKGSDKVKKNLACIN